MATKKKDENASAAKAAASISVWEQDPGSGNMPDGGDLVQRTVPNLNSSPLPTVIQHPSSAPTAKNYSPGTAEFRYWTAADALRRGSDFWGALLPGMRWQVGSKLPIDLDHGIDLNAFYDRVGLRFFHANVSGRTVFSGESPDVICHELGHAILDSFKPQLWDAAFIEAAAFHESFGDMSAILCALQLPSLRHNVLTETGGVLYRSSRLSRLAEQLGWAIRVQHPAAVESDCLRNAVNPFFYRDPNTIPSSGPANTLSSEPHSFSRVFTGAFFEGLAGMLKLHTDQNEADLLTVSQAMGQILVSGIRSAAVVPTFFSQVAANMISRATTMFTTIAYGQALRSAFIRHGIISPASALMLTQPEAARAMASEADGVAAEEPQQLPQLHLSVAEYGLGFDTIVVHSSSEAKGFNIAGAALDIGAVTPPAQEVAAKAFLEDLIRRGRLEMSEPSSNGVMSMTVTRSAAPTTHKTHSHELRREGNDMVLRRVRIDCGFHS